MIARVNIVLAGLLVLCALGLVTSQHHARKLFIDLERAQAHAQLHEMRWNQLRVEQTELSRIARVDALARRELGMLAVPAELTLHLSVDPATRMVSLSQPWRETKPGVQAAGARAAAGVPVAGVRPQAGTPAGSATVRSGGERR
jgi:cell division protein FtsL